MSMHLRFAFLFCLANMLSLFAVQNSYAAEQQIIRIAYLTQQQLTPPTLSNLDPFIGDKGIQGAQLAIQENNTTGQFTGQQFILENFTVPIDGSIQDTFNQIDLQGLHFVVVNLKAKNLIPLAQEKTATSQILLDVGSIDDALRTITCFDHVLHFLPSRAMRADALAQYLLKKRWQKWFLVTGPSEQDQLFANAIKRSAKRFGMKLVAEKAWQHNHDARRTAQADVPVLTQGVEYDVLVVADEDGLFGEYLDYRTWKPRPVIGTQGLIATAWHRTHEQWGAVQIQNRFKKQAGRWMTEQDYAAYLAVRSIGEAATRTESNDVDEIKAYLLSEQFVLQGYKGQPLSFRTWNGQLRQPVLLAAPRSMVASAPITGFLHPISELDTLGYDQPETNCQ